MPGSDITTSQEGSTTHLLYQTSGDRVISLGGDYYQWTHNSEFLLRHICYRLVWSGQTLKPY